MIPQAAYPSFRLIVRDVFRFPDGRSRTRTVARPILGDPHDAERVAIAYQELLEELTTGHPFPEGIGVLIELLGAATA